MGHLIDERIVVVQPSLVRKIGASAAMILQQCHWHLQEGHGEEFTDGNDWMRMPYSQLSRETGLTPKQVRKAITDLVELDVLLATHIDGNDRAKWYRIDRTHALLRSDCPSAPGGKSKSPVGPKHVPQGADVPSSQTSKKERGFTHSADADFETFWGAYPRAKNKAEARRAFMRALERADATEILAGLSAQLDDFSREPKHFIPYPASWLDDDRWLDAPDVVAGEYVEEGW